MLSSLASNIPDQDGLGDEEMKYENKTKEEIGYEEMMGEECYNVRGAWLCYEWGVCNCTMEEVV